MAKPDELRARRVAREKFEQAEREYGLEQARRSLLALPEGPAPRAMVPDESDLRVIAREIRKSARYAEQSRRDAGKRDRHMLAVIGRTAWLVYIERVLALDELQRAGLTSSQLAAFAAVSWADVRGRLALMTKGNARVSV